MADGTTHPHETTCAACGSETAWAERQFRRLDELSELGMEIARGLAAQAREPEADGDVAMRFARVARAVRQTEALQSKLRGELAAEQRRREDDVAAETRAQRWAVHQQRKSQVSRIARQAVDEEAGDGEERLFLERELKERLDDLAEDIEDFAEGPLSAQVGRICHALGLDPDWSLWAQEPWAQDEIRDRPPGSVFIEFLDRSARAEAADDDPDDTPEPPPDVRPSP